MIAGCRTEVAMNALRLSTSVFLPFSREPRRLFKLELPYLPSIYTFPWSANQEMKVILCLHDGRLMLELILPCLESTSLPSLQILEGFAFSTSPLLSATSRRFISELHTFDSGLSCWKHPERLGICLVSFWVSVPSALSISRSGNCGLRPQLAMEQLLRNLSFPLDPVTFNNGASIIA